MATTVSPTGRHEVRGGTDHLVLERTFAAPLETVWDAITDPVRMVRWIGTWTGDPADGEVAFRMTAEGEDVAEEVYAVEVCTPPTHLTVRSRPPEGEGEPWHLDVVLDEVDGATRLVFAQVMSDPVTASHVGPGWEYYLDRLAATLAGSDVRAVDWDAYFPSQAEHYAALFTRAT